MNVLFQKTDYGNCFHLGTTLSIPTTLIFYCYLCHAAPDPLGLEIYMFQKIPITPSHRRCWNFLGRVFLSKTKKFEVYQTQFKFPEGRGSLRQNPFCGGGMDIFWKNTLQGVIMLIILKIVLFFALVQLLNYLHN